MPRSKLVSRRIWFKVKCADFETNLCKTREDAERRKHGIEDAGLCHLHHEIVECYENGMTPRPQEKT